MGFRLLKEWASPTLSYCVRSVLVKTLRTRVSELIAVSTSRRGIVSTVTEMAEAIAESLGLEIVDVEYVKEGQGYFLRVFIDKPGGVGLDDCEALSRILSDRLDEVDPIPGSYSLEVSSPGLERPLKKPADFQRFSGQKVKVRTYAPIDGRKNWTGMLLGFSDGEVQLDVDGEPTAIPFDSIAKAHLVAEF